MFPTQFTGASFTWERKKFSKIVQRISTTNSNKSLPNIEFEDIDSEIGTLNKSTSQLYKRKKGILFEKNNILFGKLRPYLKKWFLTDFSGIAVGDFWVLKPSDNQARFVYYLIQTNSFYNVSNITSGTKMPRSDWTLVSKTKFYIPMKLSEKHKLGMILYSIDKLINLHERKCEELALIKKALLQKLFPKKDEIKPEVRYKNFSDAWEQRKLGEVADVRDGTHDSPKYINEGYPLLTSKNVGNGYINYDDVKYVSEKDYVQINKRSKVDVNDILMGMIGTIGNLALIREEPDFAIKNVALIKYTSNFDHQFLFQELQTNSISKELLSGMDGGTQKFVSLKKIRNLSVMFPSKNEQNQIGLSLARFDDLIALHQRKLERLKQLKKFLLQNMFI
ncbi:restriction endonuclease subunit S [Ligilactobacillus salivarius]|uniref:restriction endonuclease subunit S n=1 Tax=Ligilactobacillus salivarius TaxID=1624 RepID=UPI000B35DA1D|nr:restriction endonuclease subunit S [Ligilactobacillus salivarius]